MTVHYVAASWISLLGLLSSVTIVVKIYPSDVLAGIGMLPIIIAQALLGTPASLSVALLGWWLLIRFTPLSAAPTWSQIQEAQLLLLYLLAVAACWVAARPLRASVEHSFAGWERARQVLEEVRTRRAEIYRAFRSLEEATFRIERMNNELLIAQQQLETVRAAKARFVAMVSHELRAPLNLILGFSRLMALSPESYGQPLPGPYRADADTIYRNAQHLVSLVDDILDLSQIEAQHLPLVKDRIDLARDVIDKVIDIVKPLAERKGLYIRREIPPDLPWLLADPVRLRQVVLNLMTNAIRFTDHGGITLKVSREDSFLVVVVQDTGRGIPAEEIPRLFQEFHQVHQTERREERGSGLGLAIAQHLVKLHGGQIRVESTLGKGTTFCFSLPLPEVELNTGDIVSTGMAGHAQPHDVVLVIHDDPDIIRLLARHLQSYRVVGLPFEGNILTHIEELCPKAILTEQDHLEEMRKQLADRALDVPIIACEMPSVHDDTTLEGILAYLVKPIKPDVLSAVMTRLERDGELAVLIVDDDPEAVRLIERMLTAIPHPYRILKAYDGQQALRLVSTELPDVMLLDLVMPGLDGRELIKAIRADPATRELPVVIISARDWVEESAFLGGDYYLHWGDQLPLPRGMRCLKALLDAVEPSYLSPATDRAPSATAPRDREACAAPDSPPEHERAEAHPAPSRR